MNVSQYYEFGNQKLKCTNIKYQIILDYAIANSIPIPSNTQNLINCNIITNLINEGIWDSLDIFYYFKQEVGLEEFAKINWIDPTKHKLTNGGTNNVTFIGGQGFKVAGGNDQYFSTNFNPSIDAVNATLSSVGCIVDIFDLDTTYITSGRIVGGEGSISGAQVHLLNSADGQLLTRLYTNSNTSLANQSDFNNHIHVGDGSKHTTFINDNLIYEGGVSHIDVTDTTIDLFGFNLNGVHYPSEAPVGIGYFAFGSDLNHYQKEIYEIFQGTYYNKKVSYDGILSFDTSTISATSIMFVNLYPSSDFPTITTTKDYIVVWSTEHDSGAGGIWWGEANNLNLSDLTENGLIIDGYQSETPFLVYRPSDIDGDVVYLYYHTDVSDPSNYTGVQETHLITTSGGLLHTAIWTDRGKPLGLIDPTTTEAHTGYLRVYTEAGGNLTGIHATTGWVGDTIDTIVKWGKSTSVDGRTFTRENSSLDVASFMPYHRSAYSYHYFDFNEVQYAFVINRTFELNKELDNRITLIQCDGNYNMIARIGNISMPNAGNGFNNDFSIFIKDNVANIYYIMNSVSCYHTTFNLAILNT